MIFLLISTNNRFWKKNRYHWLPVQNARWYDSSHFHGRQVYRNVYNWSGFVILLYYWITGFTKASLASSMMSTIGTTRSIIWYVRRALIYLYRDRLVTVKFTWWKTRPAPWTTFGCACMACLWTVDRLQGELLYLAPPSDPKIKNFWKVYLGCSKWLQTIVSRKCQSGLI